MKILGLILALAGALLIYGGYTGKSWKELIRKK